MATHNHIKEKTNQPAQNKRNLKWYLIGIAKLLSLLIFFVFTSGHERANPKVGSTSIEFYANDMRNGLKEVTKNSLNEIEVIQQLFYYQRNYLPAWTINFKINDNYKELDSLIGNAKFYGLAHINYNKALLDSMVSNMNRLEDEGKKLRQRIQFEKVATKTAIQFLTHVSQGIIDIDSNNYNTPFFQILPNKLNEALANNTLSSKLEALQPRHPYYINLRKALYNYLTRVSISDNINTINSKTDKQEIFNVLKSLEFVLPTSAFTDEKYEIGLKKFQKHHGLKADGKLSKRTLRHFNTSTRYRYYQIAVNLDRIRKAQIENDNFIFVNIPEYKLTLFENREATKEHIVVVGRPSTPTPVLNSTITKVVANPYWVVPKSITYNEILPRVSKDSTYLQRNGYELVDYKLNPVDISNLSEMSYESGKYWLRQKKGNGNALGLVKFVFPNDKRVYLHDTPSKSKFNYDIRAYSHGCVRVHKPQELAEYITSKYALEEEKETEFADYIKKRRHKEFELANKLDVHLSYLTCKGNENGEIFFFTDIYKKDKKSIEALFPETASI